MKNVRVKVRYDTCYGEYNIGIYANRKLLLHNFNNYWRTEVAAIRNAKAMAKRIGIPYSDEIIKQHGC